MGGGGIFWHLVPPPMAEEAAVIVPVGVRRGNPVSVRESIHRSTFVRGAVRVGEQETKCVPHRSPPTSGRTTYAGVSQSRPAWTSPTLFSSWCCRGSDSGSGKRIEDRGTSPGCRSPCSSPRNDVDRGDRVRIARAAAKQFPLVRKVYLHWIKFGSTLLSSFSSSTCSSDLRGSRYEPRMLYRSFRSPPRNDGRDKTSSTEDLRVPHRGSLGSSADSWSRGHAVFPSSANCISTG